MKDEVGQLKTNTEEKKVAYSFNFAQNFRAGDKRLQGVVFFLLSRRGKMNCCSKPKTVGPFEKVGIKKGEHKKRRTHARECRGSVRCEQEE